MFNLRSVPVSRSKVRGSEESEKLISCAWYLSEYLGNRHAQTLHLKSCQLQLIWCHWWCKSRRRKQVRCHVWEMMPWTLCSLCYFPAMLHSERFKFVSAISDTFLFCALVLKMCLSGACHHGNRTHRGVFSAGLLKFDQPAETQAECWQIEIPRPLSTPQQIAFTSQGQETISAYSQSLRRTNGFNIMKSQCRISANSLVLWWCYPMMVLQKTLDAANVLVCFSTGWVY